jgi:hypothetical protein
MAMTQAARDAQSERMKQRWANRKIESPADPALQEALAKAPMNGVTPNQTSQNLSLHVTGITHDQLIEPPRILVQVDWQNVPMLEGQKFYAHLKEEFEKAGRILNARSMERTTGYTCFMCGKHFDGNPRFSDHSYADPLTGLHPVIHCCGELCVINYNAKCIKERHDREMKQAAEQRGE